MIRTIKNLKHLLEAVGANFFYGFPSKKLKVIGVTGTDGKTTTTALIYHILKHAGKKVSMVSTVYAMVGNEEFDTGLHTTSPRSYLIQKLLSKSVKAGDEFFVLETTSHALDQFRVFGIEFAIGVVTNVTHEHLDYHKSYDRYLRAKANMLLLSHTSLINKDDQSFPHLKKILDDQDKKYMTYGLKDKADYSLDMAKKTGLDLTSFNKYNYLAAYAVCWSLSIEETVIFDAMKTFKLPKGRVDMVYNKEFKVIIDFAHTPNSIKVLLTDLKKSIKKGRLIHVFSAAAERDSSKRPLMGEESGERADLVILTEEDYRREDPLKINKEIADGLERKGFKHVEPKDFGKAPKTYTIIVDRHDAIEKAIAVAQKGDIIVTTGKSHEKSLARNGTEYPWDEYKSVEDALKKK